MMTSKTSLIIDVPEFGTAARPCLAGLRRQVLAQKGGDRQTVTASPTVERPAVSFGPNPECPASIHYVAGALGDQELPNSPLDVTLPAGVPQSGGFEITESEAPLEDMLLRSLRFTVMAVLATLVSAVVVTPTVDAEAATRPVVAVIGDSYTAAWGARVERTPPTTDGAWWRYTATDLGWTPGTIIPVAGGGFVKRGAATGKNFVEALRATPLSPDTDYVLLQGGYNDKTSSPVAVRSGVREVLQTIRLQAPRAVVIMVGAFLPSPDRITSNYVQVARILGSSGSIGSTPYMSGFMCYFTLASDGTHPDAAGHRAIGHWVARRIAQGMDNAPPFHKDPTGTFYIA
jgi:lysophospholipase L1-like esterase